MPPRSYFDFLKLAEESPAVVIVRDDSAPAPPGGQHAPPTGIVTRGSFTLKKSGGIGASSGGGSRAGGSESPDNSILIRESYRIVHHPAGLRIVKIDEAGDEQVIYAAGKADSPDLEPERLIAEALKIDVLGEYENGTVVCFSAYHKKMFEIQDIDRLRYGRLLQHGGPPIRKHVAGPGVDTSNLYRLTEVISALGQLAGVRRLDDRSITGIGCWTALTASGEETQDVLLVGAGEAAKCTTDGGDGGSNGGGGSGGEPELAKAKPKATQKQTTQKLARIEHPRDGTRLLGISGSTHWYDFDNLSTLLENYSPQWAESVIREACELFGRWRWTDQSTAPLLVTGLVIATWVQTLWEWRPQLAVCGRANTGKTTLLESLEQIFGGASGLVTRSSKSSAAGIRQSVQQSARAVLIDEFENSRHRDEILEMIRASSRGDTIILGTPGQKRKEYVIRHLIWLAATEVGLRRVPDKNRFIVFELLPALPGMAGKLSVPPDRELKTLGQKLLAIAVHSIARARKLAVKLKSIQRPGIDPRTVESFAVPAAMLSAAVGDSDAEAAEMLGRLLATIPADAEPMSDESELMQAILSYVVRLERGQEATIGKLLESTLQSEREALERYGVTVVLNRRGRRDVANAPDSELHLFIDYRDVRRKILKQTEWEKQSIDQILKRIDGAEKGRVSISGRRAYGILVPMAVVYRDYLRGPDDEERAIGQLVGNYEKF